MSTCGLNKPLAVKCILASHAKSDMACLLLWELRSGDCNPNVTTDAVCLQKSQELFQQVHQRVSLKLYQLQCQEQIKQKQFAVWLHYVLT